MVSQLLIKLGEGSKISKLLLLITISRLKLAFRDIQIVMDYLMEM